MNSLQTPSHNEHLPEKTEIQRHVLKVKHGLGTPLGINGSFLFDNFSKYVNLTKKTWTVDHSDIFSVDTKLLIFICFISYKYDQ